MSTFKTFFQHSQWKILLIRILVNGGSLILTALIIPDIYFKPKPTPLQTLLAILIISIGLGILNAVVKPIILLLTGQLIFATFGLLVVLVNTLILYLLARFFPNFFVVSNFFWALVGGAVLGLVSNALENLMGLTPPIVPEGDIELRKRIEAKQHAGLVNLVVKPQMVVQHDVETQSASELTAAKAALDTLQAATAPVAASQPGLGNLPEPPEAVPPPPDASQIGASEPRIDEKTDPIDDGGAA